MRRLCIVPRWGGGPDRDFYPWLRASLDARAPMLFDEILSPEMPSPGTPTIEGWVGRIEEIVGRDPRALVETVIIGHSVGCQAVLRFLARLPEGARARGALLVAGWFQVDKPWDTLRPWMDTPIDDAAVRAHCDRFVVLLSDNDPFTASYEENGRAWEERLGAQVVMAPGRRHFNEAEEPAVLEALVTRLGLEV